METDRYKPGLGKKQGLVQQLREFQRNPRSLIFVSLAESYRVEGLPHQALEILDEGLAFHPGLASAVVARARCLFDLKRYAEALSETSTALRNNPQNIRAHKLQAEIYVRLGQRKAAIRALTQVVSLFPQDLEAVRSLEELENLESKLNAPVERLSRASVDTPPTLGRIEDFQVGSFAESMAPLKAKDVEMVREEKPTVAMEAPAPALEPKAIAEASVAPPLIAQVVAPRAATAPTLSSRAPMGAELAGIVMPVGAKTFLDPLDLSDETEPAFATRTIAELYLRQGWRDKAGRVLRKIVKEDPANQWARETLQELESDGIVLPQPPALAKRPVSLEKKAKALEKMLARVRLIKPMGAL